MTTAIDDRPLMVYVTCGDSDVAERIAIALVEIRAAACVNIVPGLQSVYRWQGAIEIDPECLLLIKTRQARMDVVRQCVERLHPDELPELVAVHLCDGSRGYLDWITDQTTDATR